MIWYVCMCVYECTVSVRVFSACLHILYRCVCKYIYIYNMVYIKCIYSILLLFRHVNACFWFYFEFFFILHIIQLFRWTNLIFCFALFLFPHVWNKFSFIHSFIHLPKPCSISPEYDGFQSTGNNLFTLRDLWSLQVLLKALHSGLHQQLLGANFALSVRHCRSWGLVAAILSVWEYCPVAFLINSVI